jgi:hypothetical protein
MVKRLGLGAISRKATKLSHCGLDKRTVGPYVYHFPYHSYGRVPSGPCGLYFIANEEKSA